MVVKQDLDFPVGRIIVIYLFQGFNKFPASVTISDQSINVAVVKIKAGHKADRARGACIHDRVPKLHTGEAQAQGPQLCLRLPGCRVSRRRMRLSLVGSPSFPEAQPEGMIRTFFEISLIFARRMSDMIRS